MQKGLWPFICCFALGFPGAPGVRNPKSCFLQLISDCLAITFQQHGVRADSMQWLRHPGYVSDAWPLYTFSPSKTNSDYKDASASEMLICIVPS